MAVTKLMHMKESPGVPHRHLKAAIRYILDVKNDGAKTEDGLYVGGNSGYDEKAILETFLQTKQMYGKTDGRQGYHFVLSFAPGETDAVTAYNVTRDFCEKYLGENYDTVFAVHTDKSHIHSHIIFNSVSRTDGYKYHYKEGDWERFIQPVTDEVCMNYGLAPLTFSSEKVGVSYAGWAEQKKGKLNWSHIIRADIDYAISKSSSFEEFSGHMRQMHYSMRMGYSRKLQQSYVTYTFMDDEGKQHRRRSYNLPPGYGMDEVAERIRNSRVEQSPEWLTGKLERMSQDTVTKLGREYQKSATYKRLYQAVNYYRLPNPYAIPAGRVRKDMLHVEQLLEECRYLKMNGITSAEQLAAKTDKLKKQLAGYEAERKTLYGVRSVLTKEEGALLERYEELRFRYEKELDAHSDLFEGIEDEMKEIENRLPYQATHAEEKIRFCNRNIRQIKKELGMCDRIRRSEQNTAQVEKLSPRK